LGNFKKIIGSTHFLRHNVIDKKTTAQKGGVPMKNSIQYFTENGIPELEKIKLNFLENPAMFDRCVDEVWKVFLQTACYFICGWLEELFI